MLFLPANIDIALYNFNKWTLFLCKSSKSPMYKKEFGYNEERVEQL
jgi:hypothetical protein